LKYFKRRIADMIYTVTFNPALDYIVFLDGFKAGDINRATRESIYYGGKGINVSNVLNTLGLETTALGSAYLAAYGIGELHSLDEVRNKWKLKKRYEPQMDEETREKLLAKWHKAVERAKKWEEE
jgi:hypothetical protein